VGEPFRYRLRVRYHECDPQGVVFNANYLTYFDVVITELWRELGGYTEMVDAGHDLVVAEATVRYRSPLRFDDEFDGVARIGRLGETSFTVEVSLERDGEICADGENRYVVVKPDGGGKTPIPGSLRTAMEPYVDAGGETKIRD
jgi:acyl-CoA thioester hydrolase